MNEGAKIQANKGIFSRPLIFRWLLLF